MSPGTATYDRGHATRRSPRGGEVPPRRRIVPGPGDDRGRDPAGRPGRREPVVALPRGRGRHGDRVRHVGAGIAAVASFVLYDFLFVEPRLTLTVARPCEVVNLVLLLFVGIVVGQLAALQRARAEEAIAREREARALFRVSRALATRASTVDVLPDLATILRDAAGMTRTGSRSAPTSARNGSPPTPSAGRSPPARRACTASSSACPATRPPRWSRVHQPASREGARSRAASTRTASGSRPAARPRLDLGAAATRRRRAGPDGDPPAAAAADQVGQALAPGPARGRGAGRGDRPPERRAQVGAAPVGVARPPDAARDDPRGGRARSARAAASARTDQRESADAIDREVEYLNRLVTNLLDLSADRGRRAARRARRLRARRPRRAGRSIGCAPRLGDRPLSVDLGGPAGRASTRCSSTRPSPTSSRTRSSTPARGRPDPGRRAVTAPDDGLRPADGRGRRPGRPGRDALPRLFDKFYRVPGAPGGSRSGTGIGLAVVRGPRRGDGRPGRRPGGASSAASRSTSTCRPRGRAPRPGRARR